MRLPLALLAAALLLGRPSAAQEAPPNIIVLLADDLGYGDLSLYGSPDVHAPHLDGLARRGMRFTRFYAGSAVCTPSRASLLTGRFPLRFDVRAHFRDAGEYLPTEAQTLPEVLGEAGYATAHVGKWHLGGLREEDVAARANGRPAVPGPLQHGFDHYLTNIEGAPIRPMLVQERRLYREGRRYLLRDDERAPERDGHWTEIKVDEAIRLIEGWQGTDVRRPFFLNLWFDVPHTPYEPAPEPHLAPYQALGAEGDQLHFRSMVSHLDAQVGRLVERLEALGLMENTLIVFTSDNGPAFQGSPGPFRGGKTDLHEGGVRVPMFAVWEGRIPAEAVSFQTAHVADLLPTFAEAADVRPDADGLDGRSLLGVLTGGDRFPRETLLWQMDLYTHYQNQGPKPTPHATTAAVRWPWKLLADSTAEGLVPTELFHLEQDHRELYDLLGAYPDTAAALLEEIRAFHAAPRTPWRRGVGGAGGRE